MLEEAFRGPGFSVLSLAQPAAISVPLARLGRLLGKTVVIDYRVPEPEAALERGLVRDSEGYRRALQREEKLLLQADLVLCPNEAIQHALAGRTNGLRSKLAIVPTGQDPSIGAEGTAMRPTARRRRYLVVFAGPLTEFSGADLFVRCARRLVYGLDRIDIHFVLAGSGPKAAAIRDLVAAEGLVDFVTCLPGDDPALVTSLLLSADLAVDPTPKSPLGELVSSVALQDYCRLGVPTVAFNRTEVERNDTVLAVQGSGVPELAQGVLEALERPLLREATLSRDCLWSAEAGPAYIHALKKVLKRDMPAASAVAEAH
jgi:glycosyltransferase involved in cell wall biosynthesis